MRVKILKFLFLSLLVLIAIQGWRLSTDAGIFVEVRDVPYGSCERAYGPPGSEDINIDKLNKVAFISAGNGRKAFDSYREGTEKPESGDIWLLDLSVTDSTPYALGVQIEGAFHPHGIDLLHLENGGRELYVINHPTRYDHEVLIFTVQDNHSLVLKRRVHYAELIGPNDLVAIGEGQFFATNDHGSPRGSLMYLLEDYLGLSRSSVTYFDGSDGGYLLKGIKSANGITLSGDQQTLYVAEALGRTVKRFTRSGSIRDWKHAETLPVGTMADNLIWGDEGRLLVGAHPKAFAFLDYVKDAKNSSPSHVISIDVSSAPMTYETIFMSDGSDISASSVGAMLDGQLLIGSVLDAHILRCRN